jgi:YVTN family beta-propeller protein
VKKPVRSGTAKTSEAARARKAARAAKRGRRTTVAARAAQTTLAAAIGAGILLQGAPAGGNDPAVVVDVRTVASTAPDDGSGSTDEDADAGSGSTDEGTDDGTDDTDDGRSVDDEDDGGSDDGSGGEAGGEAGGGAEDRESQDTDDTASTTPPSRGTPTPDRSTSNGSDTEAESDADTEEPASDVVDTTTPTAPAPTTTGGATGTPAPGTTPPISSAAPPVVASPRSASAAPIARATTATTAATRVGTRGTASRDRVTRAVAQNVLTRIALAFAGLTPAPAPGAPGPAAPAAPTSALLLLQWALFRRGENPLFNQVPVARPGQAEQSATGEVTGSVVATDPDGDDLTYTVTDGPERGTVVVDPVTGTYTYVPGPELARTGGTDTFTVRVRDNDPTAPGLGRFTGLAGLVLARSNPALAARLFGAHHVDVPITVTVVGGDTVPVIGVVDPANGTVEGNVPVSDPTGGPYTYTVTRQPESGRVVLDETTGRFVYIPSRAAQENASTTPGPDRDSFTVTVTRAGAPAMMARLAFAALAEDVETIEIAVPVTPLAPSRPPVASGVDVGPGSSFVLSPDGRQAFVPVYEDRTVRIVDLTTGDTTVAQLDEYASSLVVSPDGRRVYALQPDRVAVIDTATGTVVTTFEGVSGDLRFEPDGRYGYVNDWVDGTVTVIDAVTDTTTSFDAGGSAGWVHFSPDGDRAYVIDYMGGTVTIVDTTTREPGEPLVIGTSPLDPVFSPDGSRVYFTSETDGTLTVISTEDDTVLAVRDVGPVSYFSPPQFSPAGRHLYVLTPGSVSVLSTETDAVETTIPRGGYELKFSPDGSRAYLLDSDETATTVTVISTADQSWVDVPTGVDPKRITFTPDGAQAWITDRNGTVTVVDVASNTVVRTVTVGSYAHEVNFTPDGSRAYLAIDRYTDGIGSVVGIDTADGSTTTITVGNAPYDLVVSPDGRRVYVTNYLDATLTIIDTADDTVVDTVAGSSDAALLTPDGRFVYTTVYDDETSGLQFVSTADDRVTFISAPNVWHPEVRFSPDGKVAYAVSPDSEELVIISLDGDPTVLPANDRRA